MVDRNRQAVIPMTPHGVDVNGNPESVNSTNNAIHVVNVADEPGHDSLFDMTWGGLKVKKVSLTASGMVGVAGACYYGGYFVTTALSAAAITVRDDAATGGTGDIVDIIAASAAAGTKNQPTALIYCPNGVAANFAGTGTVTFFYWQ